MGNKNASEKRNIRLCDLLELCGPAQLVTVVDEKNGFDHPIFTGKAVKLIRSKDEDLERVMARKVRHFNTTHDDCMISAKPDNAGIVAETLTGQADRMELRERRGLMIHLA